MRLPRWDDVSNRPAPSPRAGAARADMNVAVTAGPEMGRQLMAAVEDWAIEAKRQREKADAVTAAKLYSETTLAWQGMLTAAQEQAPEDGAGFATGVLQQLETDLKARLEAAPQSARPWLETRLADLRVGVLGKAQEHEAGLRLAKQSRDLNDLVTLNANAVRTDPTRLGEAVGLVEGAIEASSLTAAAKAEARRQARSGIAFSALSGLNERDPAAAREALEGGRFDGYLSADAKNRLVNDNATEIRRREAEARQAQALAAAEHRAAQAELREEARWAMSALGNGEAWAGTDELIARAEKLDPKTATALRNAKADVTWTRGLLQLPPAEIADEVARARAQAEAAPDAMVAAALSERAGRGEQVLKAVTAGLDKDPLALAASAGVVSLEQLNPTDPEAMRARVVAATKAAEHYGLPSVLPFTAAEVDALGAAVEKADAAGKTEILRGLRGLPDDHLSTVMAKLAPKAPAFVAAAGIAMEDQAAAEAILQGEAVRQSQPGITPRPTDYRPEFDGLLGTAFNLSPSTRQQVEEAVLSVYAAEALRAGDTTGTYDADRFETAVQKVTGGLVEWNGQTLMPPRRGMSQDEFGDLVRGLSDPDVAGARTLAGDSLTARQVRAAALDQVGPAQYLVRLSTGYAVGEDGRPWVLDLGATP